MLRVDTAEVVSVDFVNSVGACMVYYIRLSHMYPVLQLGTDTAVGRSHVRLLRVDISSDLSLDHHMSVASTPVATTVFVNFDVSSSAVVGLRLVGYTRLRRCKFTDSLLQHCSCWCTENSNG